MTAGGVTEPDARECCKWPFDSSVWAAPCFTIRPLCSNPALLKGRVSSPPPPQELEGFDRRGGESEQNLPPRWPRIKSWTGSVWKDLWRSPAMEPAPTAEPQVGRVGTEPCQWTHHESFWQPVLSSDAFKVCYSGWGCWLVGGACQVTAGNPGDGAFSSLLAESGPIQKWTYK